MRPLYRGLLVAVLHVALVSSLLGKLVIDRHTRPRVWVQTTMYDPDLPIRGRYLSMQLVVDAPPAKPSDFVTTGSYRYFTPVAAHLEVRDGTLTAVPDVNGSVFYTYTTGQVINDAASVNRTARLSEPVLYFIPEHAPDARMRRADEQLWAEVTIPKKGPPRPIRLGVKNVSDGTMRMLDVQ